MSQHQRPTSFKVTAELPQVSKLKTTAWDPTEHLETEEDFATYLEAAFEEGDPALIAAALGDIARAKGMAQITRDARLEHESLYKALSPDGNLEFATVMKVVNALGLKLHATRAALGYRHDRRHRVTK